MESKKPHGSNQENALGLPFEEAVRRGICGAQRKNEGEFCSGPRDEKGRSVCGKHCGSKNRIGYPCANHPRQNGRCNNHGGESPVGAGHPNFASGRYSKILPKGMLNTYEHTLNDERRTELKDELALTDARIGSELERMNLGESVEAWKRLIDLWERFEKTSELRDTTSAGRILSQIGDIIRGGSNDQSTWNGVSKLINQRRQLAESERKRMVENHMMLSIDEWLALVAAVVDIVRRHEDDPAKLDAISSDLGALVRSRSPADPERAHLN